jgi:hypothetical protein
MSVGDADVDAKPSNDCTHVLNKQMLDSRVSTQSGICARLFLDFFFPFFKKDLNKFFFIKMRLLTSYFSAKQQEIAQLF